jgi:hypothetical protein
MTWQYLLRSLQCPGCVVESAAVAAALTQRELNVVEHQIGAGNTDVLFVIGMTDDNRVIRPKHKSEGGENAGPT